MEKDLYEYSRRRFLGNVTTGLMGVGMSHLLGSIALNAKTWAPGQGMTHLEPRAKRSLG